MVKILIYFPGWQNPCQRPLKVFSNHSPTTPKLHRRRYVSFLITLFFLSKHPLAAVTIMYAKTWLIRPDHVPPLTFDPIDVFLRLAKPTFTGICCQSRPGELAGTIWNQVWQHRIEEFRKKWKIFSFARDKRILSSLIIHFICFHFLQPYLWYLEQCTWYGQQGL